MSIDLTAAAIDGYLQRLRAMGAHPSEAMAIPFTIAEWERILKALRALAELKATTTNASHPFVVKHYVGDPFPTIKGNGFDGLQVGTDRQEAQEFVDWIHERLRCNEAVERDAARYRWIRQRGAWETEAFLNGLSPEEYDREIDKAMQR